MRTGTGWRIGIGGTERTLYLNKKVSWHLSGVADHRDPAAGLLERAFGDGFLSTESTQALLVAGEISSEVGEALGDAAADGDLLATILVDDSSSIGEIANGPSAVSQGHNYCLDALREEARDKVLVHTRYLNTGGLSPYLPLAEAPRLSPENYQARGKTPLYQQSVLTLGAVMAKAQQQRERGGRVRAFTIIITDGEDNASGSVGAEHVRFLVADMLDFSDDYKVAGLGIGQPERFRPVFRGMGIPETWILTAPANADEIRKLFRRIAKSLQLAASGDAGWLQLEAGPVPDEG